MINENGQIVNPIPTHERNTECVEFKMIELNERLVVLNESILKLHEFVIGVDPRELDVNKDAPPLKSKGKMISAIDELSDSVVKSTKYVNQLNEYFRG